MRLTLLRLLAVAASIFFFYSNSTAQGGFGFNCVRDTVIAGCSPNPCFTLKSLLPDIHGLSDSYTINPISQYGSNCFPVYSNPDQTGTPTNLSIDDRYTGVINIGFPFPFYGTIYNDLIASTNGVISFDISRAGLTANWDIVNGTIPQDLPATFYDRALIMGPYHDLNPQVTQPTQRIQYTMVGTAPFRKWILSFFRVPLFGPLCAGLFMNTHQIVLYESTGIIEVLIFDKEPCVGWNEGRAMVGLQNFDRDQAIMAPNRRASDPPWGTVGMNESWRFVPNSGPSLFRRAELYDIGGTLLSTATTNNLGNGSIEASFANVCPPAGATTSYIIRSFYTKIDDPTVEVYGSDTVRVTKTAPTDLGATAVSTPTACGPPSGTVTVTVPNGTAPFSYSIDGGTPVTASVNTFTFVNVIAGPHTIFVTDASGFCNSTVLHTVGQTGTLAVTAASTATSCAGAANGSITVTPTNGTGPYTFVLNPGGTTLNGSSATFTNLVSGIYTVMITDNTSGCSTIPVITAVVSAGPGLTANLNSTPPACVGATNGSILVTPTSGTGPYTFTVNPGSITQTGAGPTTIPNLGAGIYNINVTDANGCTTTPALVAVISAGGGGITSNISSAATSCAGANNGSVTVTPTSGSGPYTYTLNPGAVVQIAPAATTFTNLAPGNYTVTVRDNNNCTTTTPLTTTIIAGAGLTGTTNAVPTACPGVNNGSVTVTATSGTAPYTFTLGAVVNTSATNTTTFNGLAAGNYTVTISDVNGCVTTQPLAVTVTPGTALLASSSQTPTSCAGAINGTITITPSNGTAPYTFVLDGATTQSGTTTVFTNLSSGLHSVVVSDAMGCVSNPINITVGSGATLFLGLNRTNVVCFGGSTGSITATPPPNPGPFEYSLDNINWQTSNIFTGLPAAIYTVYVRETSTGCQGQGTVQVDEPNPLVGTVSFTPVVCNGQNNGTITVATTGGRMPYWYSVDGGTNWQTNNTFNVAAGTYTVTIRDVSSCITTQTVTITEPAALAATFTASNATCNGGADGRITVTASGGNTGYQYSSDGTTFQASNILNVIPGTYTVTVRDNLGCSFIIPGVVVGLINDLTFTPPADPTICEGTSTQLQIVSNALQYAWTPATGLSNAAVSNPTVNPSVTTNYNVRITYGNCFADVPVTVNVNAAPIPNAGTDGFICYGQNYQLQASGGTGFTWTPATYLDNASLSNPLSTPDRTITYSLSVSDANGCNSLITDDVIVDVTPPIRVSTFPYDTVLYTGDQVQLLATSVATDYLWTPSTGLNNPAIANPIVTAGAVGDVVLYKVIASTQAGCKGEGFVRVQVYKGPELYVPTGFTPNGDGKNDRFFPFPVGVKEIKYFRVFNRWGEMIFSTSRLNDGWDGKFAGREQASGVYVWTVEGITKDNRVITKRGTVMLIR